MMFFSFQCTNAETRKHQNLFLLYIGERNERKNEHKNSAAIAILTETDTGILKMSRSLDTFFTA